jgi:predicted RNA-binding Zn-ribbon protein involved in translation (DUF1610 family)
MQCDNCGRKIPVQKNISSVDKEDSQVCPDCGESVSKSGSGRLIK